MAFEHKYCDSCWSPYNLQKVEEETDRYICETCLKHEVNEANMMPILRRVLVYLEAFGFDDIQMDSITIHIISKSEMQMKYGSAAGLHCGYSTICNEKGRADFHQDIYILEHYNRNPIKTGLSEDARQVIFLLCSQVVTNEVYDNLETVLIEDEIISPEYNHIKRWDDKDINKKPLTGGGIIR